MITIDKSAFKQFVREFNFTTLFNELGWDYLNENVHKKVGDHTFALKAIAHKEGFRIFVCSPMSNGLIPDASLRKKLHSELSKIFFEHLIIFVDERKSSQVWQLVIKEQGKPHRVRQTTWHKHQEPELLYQRMSGVFFSIDEHEKLTIVDVTSRLKENFGSNAEKITKKFYEVFKKEHTRFLKFLKGIEDTVSREWYASLMLNRLMFCYFIQKKGFLNKDKDYLRTKLKEVQSKKGKDKFYRFYYDFLKALFHQGLGAPTHSKELQTLIGQVPYLNGGLFDVHELEKQYPKIQVDDAAFEHIFNFFDEWEWHLDIRSDATGNEINPDVIGYIFEKYINDRADMGAYYTKEDITDYIGRNCILPYLVEETSRRYPAPFAKDGFIWETIKNSGDTYVFESLKHGITLELPKEIQSGVSDPKKRDEWSKPATDLFGLATENWREVVDRRQRYHATVEAVQKGGVKSIDDFITLNLNIRQFIQDIIRTTDDPEFIKNFYQVLNSVRIIDPTCGSGAFLFAAMNILESLYLECIQQMETFVEEDSGKEHKFFKETLEVINSEEHPNLEYFIFKSIILRNLYGVDLMKEAVEIAKLRLFLKLVSTVEVDYSKRNLGLEPLPDIDFNIRSGNTLVGFATQEELKKGLSYTIDGVLAQPVIEEKCDHVASAFETYKEIQLTHSDDYVRYKSAKEELNKRLGDLNSELNVLLHKQADGLKFKKWEESHQPFHWFAEFYEIVQHHGGFDVIIGNPPYVVYNAAKSPYKVKGYDTLGCANLYAYCAERSFKIMHKKGRFGMIIPNSSISADKLNPLQRFFTRNKHAWISNYSWRPSKLFEGANMLLAIVLVSNAEESQVYSSMYYKWYNQYRPFLFENIKYHNSTASVIEGSIPKIPGELYFSTYEKEKKRSGSKTILSYFRQTATKHRFYYFRAVLYWVKILEKEPIYLGNGEPTTTGEMKPVYADNEELKYAMICILSSSLYFLHYITWSSCQVINSRDFELPFDFDTLSDKNRKLLVELGKKLQKDYQKNSKVIERNYDKKGRTFTMEKQYFYIKHSKGIIDDIDAVLANHYALSPEELDFVVNYDIKYRLGMESDDEDED